MIRNFLIFIAGSLLLMTISCNNSKIYISTRKSGDNIEGYRINDLFKKNRTIKITNNEKKSLFYLEMEKIKDSIIKIPTFPADHENIGFYKYAIVFNRDTLYTNSNLKAWRYKKKTCSFTDINPQVKDMIVGNNR